MRILRLAKQLTKDNISDIKSKLIEMSHDLVKKEPLPSGWRVGYTSDNRIYFINDLEKAQKECRVSRTELLEILTDKGCVKKAYKKAGFDDVPSPLERFYGYRGKIIGYLK